MYWALTSKKVILLCAKKTNDYVNFVLNMKTLIIHPEDYTTDFLEPIYDRLDNKTVLRKEFSVAQVCALIESHDRVLMMGHGSPSGLFSMGLSTEFSSFAVNDKMVEALSSKKNNFFIWCHADIFVRNNNLKGFSTGMFISEPEEATLYNVFIDDNALIENSNSSFSKIVSKLIMETPEEMYFKVKQQYLEQNIANPIVEYNASRLFLFQ
jgi:hypothetical protein